MKTLVARHKTSEHIDICSVYSIRPLVIETALVSDRNGTRKVLIGATSNQVNQFGDYTGVTPAGFRGLVFAIADKVGFARERIILGGGRLGPDRWQQENADVAMEESVELVKTYVHAGFNKIHLDASMSCADDSIPLAPGTVAKRAAVLCLAAEGVATDCQRGQLSYIIGIEAPVPGGKAGAIQSVHITQVEDTANTLHTHRKAFTARGLTEALTRVTAIAAQPGVEFDHNNTIHCQAQETQALTQQIEGTKMVYEAHSTDYQTQTAYQELIRDRFAILKVGPVLTFALCEAVFALAQIEQELIVPESRSRCLAVTEKVMLDEPQYWKKYYRTGFNDSLLDICYNLSGRIRCYWPHNRIKNNVKTMTVNLEGVDIPLGMISQYLSK